jgi:hypothetical protein
LDVKKRSSEEKIIGFRREAGARVAIRELCSKHGFSDALDGWEQINGQLHRPVRFPSG